MVRDWEAYYRARLAFVRDRVQRGLPVDDQVVLDFARQWQAPPRSLPDLRTLLAQLELVLEPLDDEAQVQQQARTERTDD